MTLVDSVNLWMILNSNEFYFQSSDIDVRIDKQHIYHIIMAQYADLECVYADTSYMHKNVELFWKKNKDRIKRLLDTLDLEYNPIENYSTVETGNLDANGTKKFTQKDNTNFTKNFTQKDNTNSTKDESIDSENKHFVSAFNNINGEDVEQTRDTVHTTDNTTFNENYNSGQDTKYNEDYNSGQDTGTTDHEETLGTKKGLTNLSYQELIDKQRRTIQFDIDDWILREFAKDLLISIW